MKLFGKKEEKQETSNYVQKIDGIIQFLSELTRQTQSDYNFGAITEEEYEQKMQEIKKQVEIAKYVLTGEVDTESSFFDTEPIKIDWLDKLFNAQVHKKIEEIDEERNKQTETD